MKNSSTPLVDEHLEAIRDIKEADTQAFFYSRLKARMEMEILQGKTHFLLKPVWVVGILMILLVSNTWMLTHQNQRVEKDPSSSLQKFAETYDQTINSSY